MNSEKQISWSSFLGQTSNLIFWDNAHHVNTHFSAQVTFGF